MNQVFEAAFILTRKEDHVVVADFKEKFSAENADQAWEYAKNFSRDYDEKYYGISCGHEVTCEAISMFPV
jgi:hypothetical protein